MATTASGFWYPTKNDTINSISGLFAQAATSSEDALNNRLLTDGISRFTDATARSNAFSTIVPINGTLTYLQSTGKYEKWNGTAWVPIIDDFPPVTGKNGVISGISQMLSATTYYTGPVVTFTQRANVSVVIFAMYVFTQASASPSKTLVRAGCQYAVDTGSGYGSYTSVAGATASAFVPDAYSFDVSTNATYLIPAGSTSRQVRVRASAVQSMGAGSRFDYVTFTAMSFGQTDNL